MTDVQQQSRPLVPYHQPVNRVSMWTEAMVADLITLWGESNSASVVAAKIFEKHRVAVSRNSVIGKVHRLCLDGVMQRRADHAVLVEKRRMPGKAALRVPYPKVRKVPSPSVLDHGGTPIHLADGCLFSTGMSRDGTYLFCNDTKRDGSSYCEHHHHRCINPVPLKRLR